MITKIFKVKLISNVGINVDTSFIYYKWKNRSKKENIENMLQQVYEDKYEIEDFLDFQNSFDISETKLHRKKEMKKKRHIM